MKNNFSNLSALFLKLVVHESTSKLPEGVLVGRVNMKERRSYGIFDECIDTRGPERPNATDESTLFDGKYCAVFFNIEVVRREELMEMNPHRDNWLSCAILLKIYYVLV